MFVYLNLCKTDQCKNVHFKQTIAETQDECADNPLLIRKEFELLVSEKFTFKDMGHSVGPNLGPDCLQRLSVGNKSHH